MIRKLLSAGVAAAALGAIASSPASAASIVLTDIGGVTQGTAAYNAFQTAARFWGSAISNNITINLNVGYEDLHSTTILGQTSATQQVYSLSAVDAGLKAVGTSAVDAVADANLPGAVTGSATVETSGYLNTATSGGVNTATHVLDNDGSTNNSTLILTTANAKALNLAVSNPSGADGTIIFNSEFSFDFTGDPGSNQIDFLAVALHEIGHSLGFDSGVDTLDAIGGPNGPALNSNCNGGVKCSAINTNNFTYATTLDLFRYSNLGAGGSPILTWAPDTSSYFSINGGVTSLCAFSSGAYNNADTPANQHFQASHWADNSGCGIMDPTKAYGEQGVVTQLDFEALDAIGYNFNDGIAENAFTTAMIAARIAIPEPAQWALMIVGFGLTGAALRRRRSPVRVRI